MAKRRTPATDDITLYDIDAGFQTKLAAFLSKKPHGIVVDISATPDGFAATVDPGGHVTGETFEGVLLEAMGSRSRATRVDPEFDTRLHDFLLTVGAHLTFGAAQGIFNVMVSNADASGKASDEDLQFALVLAEDQFWENMPAHPLAAGDRAALESALVRSPIERDEEAEEQLQRALFEPRPELEANAHPHRSVARWQRSQPAFQPMPGTRRFMTTTGETGVILGHGLMSREEARAVGDFKAAGEPYEIIEYVAGSEDDPRMRRNGRRPPPPPSSKPFDPAAPREHYAKPHHFALNMDPDAALARYWSAVDEGDAEEARDAKGALMEWLSRGGFEPDWAASGHSRAEFQALTGTSMRSRHGSPHGRHAPGTGSWRISIAGGDIDPMPFTSHRIATEYAARKYGHDGGWTVEWHAGQ